MQNPKKLAKTKNYLGKILIIEDDLSMLKILSEKLTAENFDIITAATGKDGLRSAFTNHPDLILLDMLLPQMDGLTIIRQLRADDWGKRVKILVLSNLFDLQKIDEAKKYRIADFLLKTDYDLRELSDIIKKKINH